MFLFVDFSFDLSPQPPLRRRGGEDLSNSCQFNSTTPLSCGEGLGERLIEYE